MGAGSAVVRDFGHHGLFAVDLASKDLLFEIGGDGPLHRVLVDLLDALLAINRGTSQFFLFVVARVIGALRKYSSTVSHLESIQNFSIKQLNITHPL